MKTRILAALLFLLAGLQTAWAQGFRVYQSDGTELQFSLKTDSIVFDNGLEGDEVFGPFTPVNMCIAKTWYINKYETVTFNPDGTTDYIDDTTYKFFPYQGNLVIYNAGGVPLTCLRVLEVTAERMVVNPIGSNRIVVLTSTPQPVLVQEIQLSNETLTLKPDETKNLTATVFPLDADNPEVSWESSDETVAEVNKNGRVIGNAEGTCIITCRATDGSGLFAECQVKVQPHHAYVDLGLPSGTLWATMNVGASSPEEIGDYFAWGETQPKSSYTEENYTYPISYANPFLSPEDDAATANWGLDWKMPTYAQAEELINPAYTTSEWTTQNGVEGYKITSNFNSKSIFLPVTGIYMEDVLKFKDEGFYWTQGELDDYPEGIAVECLWLGSSILHFIESNPEDGLPVRPVRKQ